MKKKLQKTDQRRCSIGIIGFLALGIGLSLPILLSAAEHSARTVPNIRHELVPHVVLPETIQYDKVGKNVYSLSGSGMGYGRNYGIISPYVATYLPFPSYQIPYAVEMKTVNQSVYPVSPKRLPLPAKKPVDKDSVTPEKLEPEPETEQESKLASKSELTTVEKDSSFGNTDVAPILLASNSESVVQAAPLASWNNAVTQTGIFCAKPPKPPVAWSFTSPIFKAAAIPTGAGNPLGNAGYSGFINQYGCRGSGTQIGFQPVSGIPGGENRTSVPYLPSPMEQGINNGVQTQILPNGMVLLTVPPDHSRCGLFRCYGNNPRMMLLPPIPGAGIPGVGVPGTPGIGGTPGIQQPPPMAPTPSGAMMLPSFPSAAPMQAQYYPFPNPHQFPVMQPQLVPITAMTPYGLTVVGYQQVPLTNPLGDAGMYGMGMGMGMMSAQQLQALQKAQQTLAMPQRLQQSPEEQDEIDNELKTPLPINPLNPQIANQQTTDIPSTLTLNELLANSYAEPYSLYAQQFGAANQNGMQNNIGNTANFLATSPIMYLPPQANYSYANSSGNTGNPYSGVYMTPYGMMVLPSALPMGGDGFMPVGMQANLPGAWGLPMQNVGMNNQGGLNLSDMLQLVMLLNNNQKPRKRLFERIAERRVNRRERHAQHDPLNQLMQMWTTPYMSPTDSIVRMPSRNAYPYGYFGAQVGQQNTANYGGYYNLYMGNTGYPGLY
ncbi:MAG: hypothetical protein LBE12_00105 [Planctomycetaceae bacterium]|nr:hypothetical protein [Planctomycetaceae bacterium]